MVNYSSVYISEHGHVVIVVKLCCVEGLMEDRCKFNKHLNVKVFIIIIINIIS